MEAVGSSETSSHFHKTTRRNSGNNMFTKQTMTRGRVRDSDAAKHKDCIILDQFRPVLISHPPSPAILANLPTTNQRTLHFVTQRHCLSQPQKQE